MVCIFMYYYIFEMFLYFVYYGKSVNEKHLFYFVSRLENEVFKNYWGILVIEIPLDTNLQNI